MAIPLRRGRAGKGRPIKAKELLKSLIEKKAPMAIKLEGGRALIEWALVEDIFRGFP